MDETFRTRNFKKSMEDKLSKLEIQSSKPKVNRKVVIFAHNNGGSINLDNNVLLPFRFSSENETQTALKIPQSGSYFLSYQIHSQEEVLIGSQIIRNGKPISQSSIPAFVTRYLSTSFITDFSGGDEIGLQILGSPDLVVNLVEGAGASISVIKVT